MDEYRDGCSQFHSRGNGQHFTELSYQLRKRRRCLPTRCQNTAEQEGGNEFLGKLYRSYLLGFFFFMQFLYSPFLFPNFNCIFFSFFFFLLYLSHARIPDECTILSDFSFDDLIVTCTTLSGHYKHVSTAKQDCQYIKKIGNLYFAVVKIWVDQKQVRQA